MLTAGTPLGDLRCTLRIAGRHNLMNALASIACGLAAGVSLDEIAHGLDAFEPVKGRSRASAVTLANGRTVTLVDDSYNANPDSVRAAIDVLATLPAPRVLVLGDMGEVGDQGEQFHAEVGAWARERGIDTFFALGAATTHSVVAFGQDPARARHFEGIDPLNAAVLALLPQAGSVLVKGSRFMRMERVLQAIAAAVPQRQPEETGHAN